MSNLSQLSTKFSEINSLLKEVKLTKVDRNLPLIIFNSTGLMEKYTSFEVTRKLSSRGLRLENNTISYKLYNFYNLDQSMEVNYAN